MKLGFVLAPLFLASTAYAQAPGEMEAAPPGMAPAVVVAPAPVKVRRWSVGLGFGSMNLAPHAQPDVESEFAVGQLAVRYLATRHLEIELAFSGGREQLGEGYEGDREVNAAVLALRYRFRPQARWNFWAMAGMGSLSVVHHEASDEERDYSSQSTLQFGAGLERRFRRFAIQLEMRAVGVAPHESGDTAPMADVKVDSPNGGMPLPPDYPQQPIVGDGMAGGQLTISGNYYF